MHDIAAIAAGLVPVRREDPTPDALAKAGRVLETFNQCAVGVFRFVGTTPWERHPDDEFLQVVDGRVEVTILAEDGRREGMLSAGHVCVVPANAWHRQHAPDGVTLIYITSREGTDHSAAETP